MPPLWDVCRLFVAVGLVRLISQGHGHCDVAAALLERKADKAECGPSSSCKSNDLSGWTVSALLSFPHPNDENLHGHHITIHHNPYWVYGISDQSNTCRHVKSVSRQTSTTEAAHNWLPYPQLAREVAPWMQAAAGCSRLQAAGCGERSRTVRWDPKVRVAHGCFCKLLLIATRLDWGTWEQEGQRRSEKASWSFHNFHACAPLVNNHWFDAWRQARAVACSQLLPVVLLRIKVEPMLNGGILHENTAIINEILKYFSISVRILSVSPCFIDTAFVQLNKLIQLRLL